MKRSMSLSLALISLILAMYTYWTRPYLTTGYIQNENPLQGLNYLNKDGNTLKRIVENAIKPGQSTVDVIMESRTVFRVKITTDAPLSPTNTQEVFARAFKTLDKQLMDEITQLTLTYHTQMAEAEQWLSMLENPEDPSHWDNPEYVTHQQNRIWATLNLAILEDANSISIHYFSLIAQGSSRAFPNVSFWFSVLAGVFFFWPKTKRIPS